jgi:hypothetical protein
MTFLQLTRLCQAVFGLKSITEMEHPSYSLNLGQNDFRLFPKIKCALKGRRFQDTEDIQKMWRRHWKLFHNRSSKLFPTVATSLG